jgi:hypothetical protein
MTRVLAAGSLSILLIQGVTAAPGASAEPARDPAIDTFALIATDRDFDKYYPTYLANGHWSMASSLPGTAPTPAQMIGVMDYTANDVSRPAAIPSWNEIDYSDGAEWLNDGSVSPQSHTRYRQTLDMRDGVLSTRYRWQSHRHATDVSVTSFVSQSAAHLAAVSVELTPHFSGTIRVRFTLRTPPPPERLPLAEMTAEQFGAASAATNRPELATGGKRDAIWYAGQIDPTTMGSDVKTNTLWMAGKAIGGRGVAVAAAVDLPRGLRQVHITAGQGSDGVRLEVEAGVRSGRSYRFTKFVAASADGWEAGVPGAGNTATGAHNAATGAAATTAAARNTAAAIRARGDGLQSLQAEHVAAWHTLWRTDILVGGNPRLQRTIHSDLFYLLENSAPDTSWPAAACGFSSHYFGHVFWDNDFWVFPSLLLLHPQRARSLITFREKTLPQALARAKTHGFSGAMYPWEADPWSGEDVTPKFAVENADREIHVNGAVALAQWQYYLASGDRSWLRDHGFPVIKAVADFWASRATYNSTKQRFELLDVTSPEEDYTHVDNEIYTNVVAHRSLKAAISAATVLGISPDPHWRDVSAQLYLPTVASAGRYFDFDPATPHDKTDSWMASSVPMLSIPALDFDADPDTLKGLLRHSVEAVGPIRERANQMVLVMLAIQAADAGDVNYFSDFIGARDDADDKFLKPPFNVRSETPQNDSVYLLATSGGFIQAFVFGLSGLRIDEQGLVEKFPAMLPQNLEHLELRNIAIRGRTVDVMIRRLPSGSVIREVTGSNGK